MSYLNQLLFGYYPYVAGMVFLLGSLVRFERDQYTWKADSSQMLRTQGFRLASNLFHVGILLLFVGHFVGLLMPHSWYPYFGLTPTSKQLMAVIAGGVFGAMCFAGLTLLVRRRLTDPRVRANTTRMDFFILFLIYAQLILGLLTLPVSLFHLDGGNMIKLADWAQRIVTFRSGAVEALEGVGLLFRLHLLLGMTIFLVFPFSRLVHIWSAPVWYLGRQGYQIVRQR